VGWQVYKHINKNIKAGYSTYMIKLIKKMSFKLKLIIIISFINILVISIISYISMLHMERSLKERMELRTKVIVDVIVHSIDDETKLKREVIEEYSNFIINEREIQYIAFFDKRNNLISIAGERGKTEIKFVTENIFDMQDNIYDVYGEIIGKNKIKIGSIIVGFPITKLKQAINKGVVTSIILWLIAIVVIMIFNYSSLTYFLRPIRDLFRAAECVSKRDFNCKIPVYNADEIGKISEQFNLMIVELESFYNSLEEKVKIATNGLEASNEKLKEKTKELEEMDKRKTEFVSIVAHDLRSPLTSMMGFADTLNNENLNLSEQDKKRYINIIRTETRRLSKLISNFLDISLIEENKIVMDAEKTDLEELINDVLNSMSENIIKGIRISLEVGEDIPQIYMDRDRIIQVLQNLIINALKYSPEMSEIKIIAKRFPDEVRISVIDQGPGIPDRQKEKIFNKFSKLSEQKAKKESGIGLGLFIAKSIVNLHGGKIWVEDAENKGSNFSFTLPIKE